VKAIASIISANIARLVRAAHALGDGRI